MTESNPTLPSAPASGPDETSSTTDSHDVPADHPVEKANEAANQGAAALNEPGESVQDGQSGEVQLTLLGSAELATRAANLVAKAGVKLHQETQTLVASYKIQQRHGFIMLMSFGSLVLVACILFGWISIRMQSRIVQLDAMLLAVGKRVVAMDDSLATLADTGNTLRDMSAKQDAISNQQARSDVRMDDMLKAVGEASTGKTNDPKSSDVIKMLQGMDARIQAQTNLVRAITAQTQNATRPALDASVVRREVEAALRQQRQLQEAAAKSNPMPASASAAAAAAPALVAKPRERVVQYPRAQALGATETQ